ncbi:MAG: hypothetical protein JXB35_04855 [Anaerolineae bacterium]|nr:hypothetical protein [Anaerolineae bacterium]
MTAITIVQSDVDQHGAKKENAFSAVDEHGRFLGAVFLYPFCDSDLEPAHPHNLYLHLHVESEGDLGEHVKDALGVYAPRRAAEIKGRARGQRRGFMPVFSNTSARRLSIPYGGGSRMMRACSFLSGVQRSPCPTARRPKRLTVE